MPVFRGEQFPTHFVFTVDESDILKEGQKVGRAIGLFWEQVLLWYSTGVIAISKDQPTKMAKKTVVTREETNSKRRRRNGHNAPRGSYSYVWEEEVSKQPQASVD